MELATRASPIRHARGPLLEMQKRNSGQTSVNCSPKQCVTVHTLAAAIYAAETAKLLHDINIFLQRMSQNVSTIDSLVRLLPSAQDVEEVRSKMEETTALFDQLLPLVHRLMATPEPKTPGANAYWWMERERINREFEQILKRFRMMHEFLAKGKMTAMSMKTLEKMLAYEMELSKKIREVCQKQMTTSNGQEANHAPAISIIADNAVSPTRSHSMEPEEFKHYIASGTMKRSGTISSVRSVSSGRWRYERRGACVVS